MLKITTEKMRWLFCGLLLLAARGAGAVSHAAPAPAPSAGDHGEHKPDGCIKPPTCLKCHAMREDIQSCSTPGVSVEKRQAGYFFARIFLRVFFCARNGILLANTCAELCSLASHRHHPDFSLLGVTNRQLGRRGWTGWWRWEASTSLSYKR